MFRSIKAGVGKIAQGRGVWVQSPQPPEANWDPEAESPELDEFLKNKEFLSIF